MLLEALESATSKLCKIVRHDSLADSISSRQLSTKVDATTAKHFVQNTYLLIQSYTPDLIDKAVSQIIESDITILRDQDLADAYTGLIERIEHLIKSIELIHSAITSMFRAVPIHYRVGFLFRDTNAKKSKAELAQLIKSLKALTVTLQSAYTI
jgi:hypothetical protein